MESELPESNINNNGNETACENCNNNFINSNVSGNVNKSEEKYFVVEFTGLIDRLAMKDKLASAKFIGVETSEPVLQIDNCFFRGQYQHTLGTHVIFDQKDMSFVAKTDKKLLMKRVFLN